MQKNFFQKAELVCSMLDIHISRHLVRGQFKSQPTYSRLTYFVPLKTNRKWQQLHHFCLLHVTERICQKVIQRIHHCIIKTKYTINLV